MKISAVMTLRLSVCVMLALLAGCGVFRRSSAWDTIEKARIHGRGDYTQSDAYAQNLHQLLSQKGIENKVVHFRYRVIGREGEPRSITQSAVIYRSETTPSYPWWFMDNMRSAPLWLPNGTVQEQVRFAERPHYFVEVIDESEEKASVEKPKPAHKQREGSAEMDWKRLFKRIHGTSYDPASTLDRRKMAALKRSHSAR